MEQPVIPTPTPTTPTSPTPTPAVTPEPAPQSDAPKPGETPPAPAVPFALTDIKLPDGMTVDESISTPFVELVNKHNIPREAVDALIALQTKTIQSNSEAGSRGWTELQNKWTAEIQADPELGGQAWAKHEASIGQMLDKYGSPELRAAFDLTGAGNNPHVVRFLSKLAATVVEPGYVPTPVPPDNQQSVESRLYPTMK